MTSLLGWWHDLLVADEEVPRPGGLAVWLSVGSERLPEAVDLALEADTPARAEAMLRLLVKGGAVGRVRLAVSRELGERSLRRLRRVGRRLRVVDVEVDWLEG